MDHYKLDIIAIHHTVKIMNWISDQWNSPWYWIQSKYFYLIEKTFSALNLFSVKVLYLSTSTWTKKACMKWSCPFRLVRRAIGWQDDSSQQLHILALEGVSSHRQSRFEQATRSLTPFVRSHRSLRSLAPQRSASLRSLAPFTGSLTHFAHSLMGQLKYMNLCSRWNCV